jgi:hypothetical protein
MKTVRELLFQRHQQATAKLDRMREHVLSEAFQPAPCSHRKGGDVRSPLLLRLFLTIWQELIWPSRFAWGGMAAIWAALFVVNLEMKGPPRQRLGSTRAVAASQTFAEQRQLLVELLQPVNPTPADRPRAKPQPRSERPMTWKAC